MRPQFYQLNFHILRSPKVYNFFIQTFIRTSDVDPPNMNLSDIKPADTVEQLFRRFDLEDGKISANSNEDKSTKTQKMGWKNEEKREELKNRDISGLKRLTEKLKKEGRGEVYWPLKQKCDSDDDLDLNLILEKQGLFPRKLSYWQHKQLYQTTFGFDRDLQGHVEFF